MSVEKLQYVYQVSVCLTFDPLLLTPRTKRSGAMDIKTVTNGTNDLERIFFAITTTTATCVRCTVRLDAVQYFHPFGLP